MDEQTIKRILNDELDPVVEREKLLTIGRNTQWEPFLEIHHVEPERVEEVSLTVLQHLAIHICLAKITPTASNRAKVCAFVRNYGGASYHRIVPLNNLELRDQLISFGQGGRDTKGMNAHPNTDAARHAPKPHSAENGRKGAEKTRGKPRNTPITWITQLSEAAKSQPIFTCEICGKEVKGKGNLAQHQRSSKCKSHDNKK